MFATMIESPVVYNKANPFLASLTERYSLCQSGSEKNVSHVILSLKGSNISYRVGDSVSVFAINDPEVVENTIKYLQATGAESVTCKHSGEVYTLRDYFTKKSNLADVPRKLIAEICQRQTNAEKKERLTYILSEGQKEALKEYQGAHEVWDALLENQEVLFSPQEFCHLLMPLLPRFYSIASSQESVGEEVHLTVAELVYETNGYTRRGVCTHYLCRLAPLHQHVIPIYVQASNEFTIPEDNAAAMIMVGPGTGVAPYRAFMQERLVRQASGANWLFFGEWHRDQQFLYGDYWQELVEAGKLRLDTAFSRDQEHKIYVQHRMLEHGSELFSWLEQGAYFYVCGDAHRMAKDVDAALHQIVQVHGKCDEASAKEYIKKLKAAKRYLRDVY